MAGRNIKWGFICRFGDSKSLSCFCLPCLALSQHLAVCVAANGAVKVLIRPLAVEQSDGLRLQEPPDSDTSSESDIEEITDIREMREIISRMDDDDDGDHDKYDAGMHRLHQNVGRNLLRIVLGQLVLPEILHCSASMLLLCHLQAFCHHLTGASPTMVVCKHV